MATSINLGGHSHLNIGNIVLKDDELCIYKGNNIFEPIHADSTPEKTLENMLQNMFDTTYDELVEMLREKYPERLV